MNAPEYSEIVVRCPGYPADAVAHGVPSVIVGGVLGLTGIFLPGMLLLLTALPFWGILRACPGALAVMRGINAGVVGLLAAALYDPLWTSTIETYADVGVALGGFVVLVWLRAPPALVVFGGTLGGMALRFLPFN